MYDCLGQLHGPKLDEAIDMIEKFILRKAGFLKHAYGYHQAAAGPATAVASIGAALLSKPSNVSIMFPLLVQVLFLIASTV